MSANIVNVLLNKWSKMNDINQSRNANITEVDCLSWKRQISSTSSVIYNLYKHHFFYIIKYYNKYKQFTIKTYKDKYNKMLFLESNEYLTALEHYTLIYINTNSKLFFSRQEKNQMDSKCISYIPHCFKKFRLPNERLRM